MTGNDEASARKGKVAPYILGRKLGRKNFRFAAIVAAIFVFADNPRCAANDMSTNIVQASSSFTNLISTILWLFGACFVINGAFKIYRAVKRAPEDPVQRADWRRGILYIFLSLGCLSFPFFQDAAVDPPVDIFNSRYTSPRIIEEHGASLKAASVICWYFCLAFLLNADISFREALRLKGDPAATALKTKTAIYLLAGFALLAAPALYALWQ